MSDKQISECVSPNPAGPRRDSAAAAAADQLRPTLTDSDSGDRPTDRQPDSQTDRQTDRQTAAALSPALSDSPPGRTIPAGRTALCVSLAASRV